MVENQNKGLLALLTVLVCLSMVVSFGFSVAMNNKIKDLETPEIDLEGIQTIVNNAVNPMKVDIKTLSDKVNSLPTEASTESSTTEVPSSDRLTKAVDKFLLSEDKDDLAEEMALEELDKKDVKKAIASITELDVAGLEDYKGITQLKVKDTEVSGTGEDRVVEFEVKVYFFTDDDEEETEKAVVKVLFDVSDLDEDEDFEEAEAELDSVSFVKLYD